MKHIKSFRYAVIVVLVVFSVFGEAHGGTGSISGTVTDTSSAAVENAFVYLVSDGTFSYLGYTDVSGDYSIEDVATGTYELHVEHYVHEYRIETGVVVTLNTNTVKNITNLAPQGLIAGRATRQAGGIIYGIEGVIVNATSSSGFSRASKTNENGFYGIGKLPAGTYTVSAYLDGYSFSAVEDVSVTAGNLTKDVDFPTGGSGQIAGTVTEWDGSTVIEDAVVMAADSSGNLGSDVSDAAGAYELTGLATGSYTVKVWRDTGMVAEATGVSVTNGQTTTRNFSAPGGSGSISGSVKDTSSVPKGIEGAIVTAREGIDSLTFYKAVTDSGGNYTVGGLAAGTYIVTVDPNENDVVAAKIDDVTVVAGQDTPNQDFSLEGEGKISGTVTDSSSPIEAASVMAVEQDDLPTDRTLMYTFIPARTDSSGNYTIDHLPTGSYTVFVRAEGFVSDSEQSVSVTAGQTTSGKGFSLGTSGGSISGTVYQSDGQTPIENAWVQSTCPGKSFGAVATDVNGDYSIPLLQSGTYKVVAKTEGYVLGILENVTVTAPNENSGNDFSLTAE